MITRIFEESLSFLGDVCVWGKVLKVKVIGERRRRPGISLCHHLERL